MSSTSEFYLYDLETYPNVFTNTIIRSTDLACWQYVISDWHDDLASMMEMMNFLRTTQTPLVGFNNIGFDYSVLHPMLMQAPTDGFTARQFYDRAQLIIDNQNDRFGMTIWPSDRLIPQIDLFKIHHFDNRARSTSLKALEFNMRSMNIQDLPFEVGTDLRQEDIPVLLDYNKHDVMESLKFLKHSEEAIGFRKELTEKYGRDFMNHNDTKIGKDYLIMRLEENRKGTCYEWVQNKRKPRQTLYDSINLGDVIFPYVGFQHPEFNRVLDWFRNRTLSELDMDTIGSTEKKDEYISTKGVISGLNCTVDNFTYHFGTGGIHGSVSGKHVKSDNEYMIVDLDVTSYYPSLAISNNVYPAHLGEEFCTQYALVKEERAMHPKKTHPAINAMLKLALNGVYGDSNNRYSPFYDPKYMLTITINGQLLLCMLAEMLAETVPGLEMIQANTDGLTVRIPRTQYDKLNGTAKFWETITGLELEEARYSDMIIRDVNNYISVYEGEGKESKRKGAYQILEDRDWHQNQSKMIVPLAAFNRLVHGVDHAQFIRNHKDAFDFMIRIKAPRSHRVMWGEDRIQNTSRYYVSTDGKPLTKIMPAAGPIGQYKKANGVAQHTYDLWHAQNGNVHNPEVHTKNKSIYAERVNEVEAGQVVTECNNLNNHKDFSNINYDYYIAEAHKLVEPFL